MSILGSYWKFLQKSVFSSLDDIQRPYHKIVNLILKIVSLAFIVGGLWLNLMAMDAYVTNVAGIPGMEIINLTENVNSLDQIIAISLFGISFILVGSSIGLVLLLRYIAFALPDRIFLRFSKKIVRQFLNQQDKQSNIP